MAVFQLLAARPQSGVILRSASQISLVVASSLGKCPRVLMIFRSLAFTLSMPHGPASKASSSACAVADQVHDAGLQRPGRVEHTKRLAHALEAIGTLLIRSGDTSTAYISARKP